MKARKKGPIITMIGLVGLIIFVLGFLHQKETSNKVQVVTKTTPTFFFHGWGSSYHAEEDMVKAAQHAGVTNDVIRINVTSKNKVIFHGKLKKNAKNPIIEVNFDDNKLAKASNYTTGYDTIGADYVNTALNAVTKKYHYNKVNIVAQSMGNLETAYYFKKYPNKLHVEHFVSIAGHYDGIIGMNDEPNELKVNKKTGKPNIMRSEYRGLLPLRKTFPRDTRVLNIYGNLEDGTNSDGDVGINSAKSLKYLVKNRAKSYQELMIKGKNAQHSKLHDNDEVNRAIIKFLWE